MGKIDVIKSKNTNCYLINTETQKILIDAGTTADYNFLKRLEVITNISQIDLVVLTHGHYDHVGYAPILQKKYHLKIAIHKKDIPLVANANMDFPKAKGFFSSLIRKQTISHLEKATYTAFTPDIVIETNTLIGYPEIQFIPLPGHTPGSIGMIYDNNLFAGDLVMNVPFPSLSWFAEDFFVMRKSLREIQNINIKRVYPGHGNDFSGKWLKRIG